MPPAVTHPHTSGRVEGIRVLFRQRRCLARGHHPLLKSFVDPLRPRGRRKDILADENSCRLRTFEEREMADLTLEALEAGKSVPLCENPGAQLAGC